MSTQLHNAINTSSTFPALTTIAEQLEAKISFWGSRWVVLRPVNSGGNLNYNGSASLDAVLKRTIKIIIDSGRYPSAINLFTNSEHEECRKLEKAINHIFIADKKNINESHIITKIIVAFRKIFETNYQCEWNGEYYGRDCQILRRNSFTVWDNSVQKYVRQTEDNRLLWD